MAITNQTLPPDYVPVGNPQWIISTSTQIAQPNFRYTIVLTDLISGGTVTKDVDKNPAGYFVFDMSGFTEQYMTQVNPSLLYGFQRNTGAIRKIRFNVGETYGTTPTYYVGANLEYIVWNGAIDFLEFQNFSFSTYKYSQGNNIQLITNNKNPLYTWNPSANPEHYSNPETVNSSRSSYLYFLSSAAGDVQSLTVIGYLNNGSAVASSTITNTYQAGTTYTDKYVFIDVGYDGLLNMPAGQITAGASPIPVATYDYWIVYDSSSWLPSVPAPAEQYTFPLKRYNMVCESRYDKVTLHYLSPEGSFETQPCYKLSLRKSNTTRSSYSKLPYTLTGYVMGYTYGSAINNTLGSSVQDSIVVNTDWLTEAEVTQLKDALSSPVIYVDLGASGGYISMEMVSSSYEEKRKYNDQMLALSFELKYTHINTRQKG